MKTQRIPASESIGRRFGMLVAVSVFPTTQQGRSQLMCKCDCGNEKVVRTNNLRSGMVISCGCRNGGDGRPPAHGCSGPVKSKEYRAYHAMKARVLNPKHRQFADYGGRGITICARWLTGFESFLGDMGKAPSVTHSLDRINVNGGYEPENCRWATPTQQRANRRK